MKIDDLTIGEAKQLACMFGNQQAASNNMCCEFVGKYVVVRTYSAGVHVGVLKSRNGQECVLTDAKRIWSWTGANTLHEIASKGVEKTSKISDSVDSILLMQVIEIIPTTKEGEKCLRGAGWAK